MKGNACSLYKRASCSAPIVLWQGINITAFVDPWSVMVKMASLPLDLGSFVIRSTLITLNSLGFLGGGIGFNTSQFGCVFTLFCWQIPQPLM